MEPREAERKDGGCWRAFFVHLATNVLCTVLNHGLTTNVLPCFGSSMLTTVVIVQVVDLSITAVHDAVSRFRILTSTGREIWT